MLLGVNIDHIAVLREARQINDPNPLDALGICKLAGANQITIHLREDRRHINDADAKAIIEQSQLPVNLECSINEDIIKIACDLQPHRITIVPENRNEVTTEGGLDLDNNFEAIKKAISSIRKAGIEVSLFIDPTEKMVKLSEKLDVNWVELHTGTFANVYAMLFSGLNKSAHCIPELDLSRKELSAKLNQAYDAIVACAELAEELEIKVAAGHGLNYQNVELITEILEIDELNIGQSIIARSVFTGLSEAIKEMKSLIK